MKRVWSIRVLKHLIRSSFFWWKHLKSNVASSTTWLTTIWFLSRYWMIEFHWRKLKTTWKSIQIRENQIFTVFFCFHRMKFLIYVVHLIFFSYLVSCLLEKFPITFFNININFYLWSWRSLWMKIFFIWILPIKSIESRDGRQHKKMWNTHKFIRLMTKQRIILRHCNWYLWI